MSEQSTSPIAAYEPPRIEERTSLEGQLIILSSTVA